MATGSRTLKLSILGDVSDLNKSLKSADADVSSFGDKISKFGKIAAAGFLVAGAAAAKFAVDAVKNAAADEAAQRTLAKTIENTTSATAAQISEVEKWITTTSLAKGVTDDVIRPAFARLTRSTKDVEESQKLLNLALDISSATGKPLEAIANSLGKAYDGNTNALGKLGLGIDQSILKTKDFDKVYTSLRGTFQGFAEQEANTFEGKLRRLQIAFDETKETIGAALLPILTTLITTISDYILPIFDKVSEALNGSSGLTTYFLNLGNTIKTIFLPIFEGLRKAFGYIGDAIADNKDSFLKFGQFIEQYVAPVLGTVLGGALEVIGKIAGGVITIIAKVIDGFTVLINGAISGINLLIRAYNAIPFLPNVNEIGGLNMSTPKISAQSILGSGSSGSSVGGISSSGGAGGSMGGAGSVAASVASAISTALPSGIKYPSAPNLTASEALFSSLTGTNGNFSGSKVSPFLAQSPTINLTVNGAIDPIGTARSIYTALGMEATTSGTFNNIGGSRVVAQ